MASLELNTRLKFVTFNNSGLDDQGAISIVMLVRPNASQTAARWWVSKALVADAANSISLGRVKTSDKIFYERARILTSSSLETTNTVSVNAWSWIGIADDTSAVPVCFVGDPITRPVEAGYGSQIQGSGGAGIEGSTNLIIGGRYTAAATENCLSDVAFFGIANRRMSNAELQSHWPVPRNVPGAGWVVFSWFGYNGSAVAPDWSGNVVNGTVNGSPTLKSDWPGPLSPVMSRA